MLYLDSSAVAKLVHAEVESDALRAWLDDRADVGWISSVIVEIESLRALSRHAPDTISRLHPVLDLIELVDVSRPVRILAQTVKPATVRSLDAIHLATALSVQSRLAGFVTYDQRLASAAAGCGLKTEAPAKD